MPDQFANGAMPRVVLLARAGKAADNIADALLQAGAELVLTADPSQTDEATLRGLNPQVVLVALEPSIEHALERFDALLVDPALTVIYDEADLAAHRAGWDAARWVRHLSAKLRRDDNVLPPGTESDHDWQPSPGQIPKPSAAYADIDLAMFTREAVASAHSVPTDGMPVEPKPAALQDVMSLDTALLDAIPETQPVQPPPLPPEAQPPAAFQIVSFEAASAELAALTSAAPKAVEADPIEQDAAALDAPSLDDATVERGSVDTLSLEAMQIERTDFEEARIESVLLADESPEDVTLESRQSDSMQYDSMQFDSMQPENMSLESTALDSMDDSGDLTLEGMSLEAAQFEAREFDAAVPMSTSSVAPMNLDDDAFFLEELSLGDAAPADREVAPMRFDSFDADLDFNSSDFNSTDFNSTDLDGALDAIPATAAAPREFEDVLSFETLIAGAAAVDVPTPDLQTHVAETARPAPHPALSLGSLSLAPVDESPAVADRPVTAPPRIHDLSALEARISSLSLVDFDDAVPKPGAAESIGVVLVEAGLGGPDPARQLLSSIPAEFPAVVLVRLHLQGGRYDRLVAQMERAAALPVALAQNGAGANPGTIYFLPDGIGLVAHSGGFEFTADGAPAEHIFAALPPTGSAIVFLSGSDMQLVDTAMGAAARGTLVIAQSAEDCYDGTACAELRKRGAASGLPAELAGRLASRWPG